MAGDPIMREVVGALGGRAIEVADEHRNEVLSYDRGGEEFLTNVPEGPMLVGRLHELTSVVSARAGKLCTQATSGPPQEADQVIFRIK